MTEPIRREITLRAEPERVFDAFTVKSELERWFAATAELDLRVGGEWFYTWPPHMAARGRFLEVERPHRLVWTWDESIVDSTLPVQPEPEASMPVVTNIYTLTAVDDGTLMTLEESGHGTDEIRAMNEPGIDAMLSDLRAYLEDGRVVSWNTEPENQANC